VLISGNLTSPCSVSVKLPAHAEAYSAQLSQAVLQHEPCTGCTGCGAGIADSLCYDSSACLTAALKQVLCRPMILDDAAPTSMMKKAEGDMLLLCCCSCHLPCELSMLRMVFETHAAL
jgi:hypothetical protein